MRARVALGLSLALIASAACERGVEVAGAPSSATDHEEGAARPEPLPPELREVLVLQGAGRIDEARARAERYVEEHPDDGRGHAMVGLTWHKAGNYERALAEFRRALELSPDFYLTRRYSGESLFLLGDLDGARHEFEALNAADPGEPQGEYGLGTVELEEAHLDAAEAHFRRAIELYEALGRSDARRLRARGPELAQCHARLADVHFARGEYGAAREELVASTTIEPGNISAFYALSQVERRLGHDAEAQRALERYESAKAAIEGARSEEE